MFDWVQKTFDKLAQYFLDLFVWLFEYIFWVFDAIIRFLWDLASPVVESGFDAIKAHLPEGVIEAIIVSYEWLQYINEWVPILYCIQLFIAYYGIAASFFGLRFVLAFLPWGGRKI